MSLFPTLISCSPNLPRVYIRLCKHGNHFTFLQSCENPSNIWEINYGPQTCGANKLTGKMELVLQLNEWTSLPSHGTFQRYVFMLSTRFVRTSGNNFNCLTKHLATLSSLSSRGVLTARVMMNMLAIRYFSFMLKTEESVSEIDSHHILQETSELWSCN